MMSSEIRFEEATDASADFNKKYDRPGALIGELGPDDKSGKRIAVKKADLVIFRDAMIQAQTLTFAEKERRNVDETTANEMTMQMKRMWKDGGAFADRDSVLRYKKKAKLRMGIVQNP